MAGKNHAKRKMKKITSSSLMNCMKTAKSDNERAACKKRFHKKFGTSKDYDPLWAKGRLKKGEYPEDNIFHKTID